MVPFNNRNSNRKSFVYFGNSVICSLFSEPKKIGHRTNYWQSENERMIDSYSPSIEFRDVVS